MVAGLGTVRHASPEVAGFLQNDNTHWPGRRGGFELLNQMNEGVSTRHSGANNRHLKGLVRTSLMMLRSRRSYNARFSHLKSFAFLQQFTWFNFSDFRLQTVLWRRNRALKHPGRITH